MKEAGQERQVHTGKKACGMQQHETHPSGVGVCKHQCDDILTQFLLKTSGQTAGLPSPSKRQVLFETIGPRAQNCITNLTCRKSCKCCLYAPARPISTSELSFEEDPSFLELWSRSAATPCSTCHTDAHKPHQQNR